MLVPLADVPGEARTGTHYKQESLLFAPRDVKEAKARSHDSLSGLRKYISYSTGKMTAVLYLIGKRNITEVKSKERTRQVEMISRRP